MTENVVRHQGLVDQQERTAALGYSGAVVWLTGLSGSGKSTVAYEAERQLVVLCRPVSVLDGDNLRHGLNADLGFGEADRRENIRRVSEIAVLMAQAGVTVFVPLISPYRTSRDLARATAVAAGVRFIEVFVDTPLDECERRDPKGLYAKARAGEITGFTGVDDPYEAPVSPELRLTPGDGSADEQASALLSQL